MHARRRLAVVPPALFLLAALASLPAAAASTTGTTVVAAALAPDGTPLSGARIVLLIADDGGAFFFTREDTSGPHGSAAFPAVPTLGIEGGPVHLIALVDRTDAGTEGGCSVLRQIVGRNDAIAARDLVLTVVTFPGDVWWDCPDPGADAVVAHLVILAPDGTTAEAVTATETRTDGASYDLYAVPDPTGAVDLRLQPWPGGTVRLEAWGSSFPAETDAEGCRVIRAPHVDWSGSITTVPTSLPLGDPILRDSVCPGAAPAAPTVGPTPSAAPSISPPATATALPSDPPPGDPSAVALAGLAVAAGFALLGRRGLHRWRRRDRPSVS